MVSSKLKTGTSRQSVWGLAPDPPMVLMRIRTQASPQIKIIKKQNTFVTAITLGETTRPNMGENHAATPLILATKNLQSEF
jgi:hypothetical protein